MNDSHNQKLSINSVGFVNEIHDFFNFSSAFSHHLLSINLQIVLSSKLFLISYAGFPTTIGWGSTSFSTTLPIPIAASILVLVLK
jgi:hypothetical protein